MNCQLRSGRKSVVLMTREQGWQVWQVIRVLFFARIEASLFQQVPLEQSPLPKGIVGSARNRRS
jgi:hypothetical protein